MKKIIKSLSLVLVIISSFYITNKIVDYSLSKNPIMKEIVSNSSNLETGGINAIIEDETIIPGISGKEINLSESFRVMKSLGYYDEKKIIYSYVFPQMSLKDNIDKIIIKGNPLKKGVSLIINDNAEILDYAINNGIKVNTLINLDDFKSTYPYELINIDEDNYDNLETLLNKYKLNKNICIIDFVDRDLCLKEKKYLIKLSSRINNTNFIDIKKEIDSGNMYFLEDTLSLSNFKILLNEITYKGLEIIYLSDLISEN